MTKCFVSEDVTSTICILDKNVFLITIPDKYLPPIRMTEMYVSDLTVDLENEVILLQAI